MREHNSSVLYRLNRLESMMLDLQRENQILRQQFSIFDQPPRYSNIIDETFLQLDSSTRTSQVSGPLASVRTYTPSMTPSLEEPVLENEITSSSSSPTVIDDEPSRGISTMTVTEVQESDQRDMQPNVTTEELQSLR